MPYDQPTRAVVLHGMPGKAEYFDSAQPSASNAHWLPWLQNELLIRGYDAQTPEMFDAYKPEYRMWASEFERYVVPTPMVLVGHSCGAGFLLRWLSEHPAVQVDTLALVAPWLDPHREDTDDFFEFAMDSKLTNRIERFHPFESEDDIESVRESVGLITELYPDVTRHRYSNMGHFCLDQMGTVAFPDLLQVIVGPA